VVDVARSAGRRPDTEPSLRARGRETQATLKLSGRLSATLGEGNPPGLGQGPWEAGEPFSAAGWVAPGQERFAGVAVGCDACGLFERFTDEANKVVDLARQEAKALGHNYVGVEHVLLGLLREQHGIAARALDSLGVTLELVRARIVERAPARKEGGPRLAPPGSFAPFTPRAKRVLELSFREALSLGKQPPSIGPEHILLSLAREGQSLATVILLDLGIDFRKVRETVLDLVPDWRSVPAEPVPPSESDTG
jgi:hypothetical protein